MFKQVLAMALSFLGFTALPKGADGKSMLTTEMEQKLTERWGKKFVESFKIDLAAEEAKGTDLTVENVDVTALQSQLSTMKTQLDAAMASKTTLETEKSALTEKVETLEKVGETDNPKTIDMSAGGAGKVIAFKPNMAFTHNKIVADYFKTGTMQYSGDDTINTTELQTEFGKYISGQKLDVFRQINLGLTITNYMTTIVTDKTEWRATEAIQTSVLQQFTPKWTPKGSAKFTPITIKNFKLKVNVAITPSDIIDQYIGYLYDEAVTPEQMPIVAFIVNTLVLPKLLEDLEVAMATGKFVERTKTQDGVEGSDAEESMDGVLTILKDLKAKVGNRATWLLDGVTLTDENILSKMATVVDSIPYRYQKQAITIHADPDLIRMYGRAYQKAFPTTKNQDGEMLRLDFSKLTFAPVDGFIGTKAFVITPKVNFIHLQSRNVGEAKVFMQVINYDVKIFMEFWKGTGFAMEEAIFAYLPDSYVAGESELEPASTGGGI